MDMIAAREWMTEADSSIDYDEDTYNLKARYVKLWDTILTKLDEWERNFFIYDYMNEDTIEEKAKTIHLNPSSYRVYQSNIRKHIRTYYNDCA